MLRRWAGPLITLLILGGVVLVLAFNLNSGTLPSTPGPTPAKPEAPPVDSPPIVSPPVGFKEYPIGEPVIKNHLQIAAVWLPPIQMEGMPTSAGADLIHLEADIHATEENPNGFAKGEFVPYLEIRYTIAPAEGGPALHQGKLLPMVARDGLHYGASVLMPRAGSYRLTYDIAPPSVGGLGRHSDPVTGVAPWWKPFQASFEWDYPGPPKTQDAEAGDRPKSPKD